MKFIDLFAGIGGFRLAAESFGLKCVFSSEIDKYACDTYEANFGERPSGDITKIDERNIPAHDMIFAGFPCQSFSVAGKRKGTDDPRGQMFFEILRIAGGHSTPILVLENVPGLLSHNGGATFNRFLHLLDLGGYNVYYKVLNAADYGLPQRRKRLFMVCYARHISKPYTFPEPIPLTKTLGDILETNVTRDIANTVRVGGRGSPIGSKQNWDGYYVGNIIHRLTPRECARLQGFPDSFKIPVSDAQAYKQFGNSVAIYAVKAIIDKIL
jgi:DNA (cytosine-5)-methyltransferase 1